VGGQRRGGWAEEGWVGRGGVGGQRSGWAEEGWVGRGGVGGKRRGGWAEEGWVGRGGVSVSRGGVTGRAVFSTAILYQIRCPMHPHEDALDEQLI
jgi:hypothetical protein